MVQSVLITGASRGLGYCFARKYLEDGALVFAGVRDMNSESLNLLKQQYPDKLIPVKLDVTATSIINEAVKMVEKYTDHIDILINNAAIHSETSFEVLENADIDQCLEVYDINAVGPIRVVKAFLQLLKNSQAAQIINISSESGSISTCKREKEFDYCMSKAALNMGTKLLSNYLKKDNIKVLAVHPGWMRTDMGGSNAALDPYETACQLVYLFNQSNNQGDEPIFIDNTGNEFPW
ncbi:MAG: SDR family oxidoreductase [Clostridiales bacterium]|nr:SDR family oxidoreductase [Clostridiales bacterium]